MDPKQSTPRDPYGAQLAYAVPSPRTAYQLSPYDLSTLYGARTTSTVISQAGDSYYPPCAPSESTASAYAYAAGQHQQQQYQHYQARSMDLPAIGQTVGSAGE